MVERLGEVVKDLGKQTAGDATALSARRLRRDAKEEKSQQEASSNSKQNKNKEEREKIELDEHGLPQPSGGRKEYTDDQGRVVRVVEWFGYKLHLLVDVRHEVALAYRISSSKVGDNEVLPELVEYALPFLRIGGTFVAYKGPRGEAEVEEAAKALELLGGKVREVCHYRLPLGQERRIMIFVQKERPTPPGYPRRAGIPHKRPVKA